MNQLHSSVVEQFSPTHTYVFWQQMKIPRVQPQALHQARRLDNTYTSVLRLTLLERNLTHLPTPTPLAPGTLSAREHC